jgi:hypothetical protein
MARRHKHSTNSIHESFADLALLMLATFIFLLVTILITSNLSEQNELPKLRAELSALKTKLNISESDKDRLLADIQKMIVTDSEGQLATILDTANIGRKDFDLFIDGLKDIPGKDLHLIVDATGSMHGVAGFLIPVLRMIVIRANKQLKAITWFSDSSTRTYTGTMAEMFDLFMNGAPFTGNIENIGHTFHVVTQESPAPDAYLLVGDEPSDDVINYNAIPSPVFTLPLGRSDPYTEEDYLAIAQKTGGKMLRISIQ